MVGAAVEKPAKVQQRQGTATIKDLKRRLTALKNEFSGRKSQWQDLCDQLSPFSGVFDEDQRTRSSNVADYSHIYDATGIIAVGQTAAGLMSYGTSPARPWHRNTVSDPELAEMHSVQSWLDDVTKLQQRVLVKSNVYQALPMLYEHAIVYGTACALVLFDSEDVVRVHVMAPGTYYLAQDHQGRVDTLYREFAMTAAQIAERWPDSMPRDVATAMKAGNLDQWFTVCHAIEPRNVRDHRRQDRANMPWRSVYWVSTTSDHEAPLDEGGFRRFPVLAHRWKLNANDVYGEGPGVKAIPFCNQLQAMTLVKGKAAQGMADPAWQIPAELKNSPDVDTEPGGHVFYTQTTPSGGVRPLREQRVDLAPITADIMDTRAQIRAATFADLFTMLVEAVEGQMTAAEFGMRVQQKMLMLGPVVQSLNTELLAPLLDLIYEHLMEAGMIPPPPPELSGTPFLPEFMGVLAQAQKASGLAAVERLIVMAGTMAQAKPDILDGIDFDAMLRNAADMLGVDPDNLVPPERMDELRQARARAESAKEQVAMLEQQGSAAAKFAQAEATSPGTLTDPVGQFTGYSAGAAV